jgi:hypothetical protein
MQVKLKDSKGATKVVELSGSDSVQKLRGLAASQFGLTGDSSSIKLIYHGKLLADDKTVESYEIKEQGVIMVIATKKTDEQVQNDKDYQDHKEVTLDQAGC